MSRAKVVVNPGRKDGVGYVIQENGCWEWTGTISREGYGRKTIRVSGRRRSEYAHRWMYQAKIGPIPAGAELDHLCRNRKCVNPAHLEAVSHLINATRGAATKISDKKVAEIRRRHAAGSVSTRQLAREFRVGKSTVWRLVSDASYR